MNNNRFPIMLLSLELASKQSEDAKGTFETLPIYKLPKGTLEYFFNSRGDFSNDRMLKSECVFACVAINDKNAIRKFDNHMSRISKKQKLKFKNTITSEIEEVEVTNETYNSLVNSSTNDPGYVLYNPHNAVENTNNNLLKNVIDNETTN